MLQKFTLEDTAPGADKTLVVDVEPGSTLETLSVYLNTTGGNALTSLKLCVLEGDCSGAFDYSKWLAGWCSPDYNVGVGVSFSSGINAVSNLKIPIESRQITLFYWHVVACVQYRLVAVIKSAK